MGTVDANPLERSTPEPKPHWWVSRKAGWPAQVVRLRHPALDCPNVRTEGHVAVL